MSARVSGLALICAFSLVGCGGGGGGGSAPAPSPSPSPTPADTTPPDTTLNSTTPALSNSGTGNFSATSTETGGTFEASLDGGNYAAVAATFALSGLADGAHTVSVRARDAAGNADATPATFSWTVDTQAPDTSISGGPPASTSSQSASFTLSSPDAGATFEASIDGAAFAAVTSPLSVSSLAIGAHTLNVRARDAAGNLDASPATFNWTVIVSGTPTARIVFPGAFGHSEDGFIKIRGTASGSTPISSVELNVMGAFPVPADSTDGFLHWTASMPVLSASDVVVTVSVTDSAGATNTNAARTTISNSGHIISELRGVLFDTAGNRLLALDRQRQTLLRFRSVDRYAVPLSNANHGMGPSIVDGDSPLLDAANNRVLIRVGDGIMAVNLANGDRTMVAIPQGNQNLSIDGSFAYDSTSNAIYAKGYIGASIIRINLGNGARSVLTGQGVGNGPSLDTPDVIRLDTSGVPANPRLLVTQAAAGVAVVDLATGDRSLLTGSGVFPGIRDFIVDAVSDRLLVLIPNTPTSYELGTLSLVNAASGTYAASRFEVSTATEGAFMALDGTGANVYVGTMDRARILRYNFGGSPIAPFNDSLVGSGPLITSTSNLDLDTSGPAPILYSSTRYPNAGVVRLDLGSGARSIVSMNTVAGSGAGFLVPNSIALDLRPGAPPNNMLVVDEGAVPHRIAHVDLATGDRTYPAATLPLGLDAYFSRPWIFDAPRGRFVRGLNDAAAVLTLGSLDADGILSVLSAPYWGTGPAIDDFAAVAAESSAGGGVRYIVADNSGSGQIVAVDPATGDRTLIAGPGAALPYMKDIVVDSSRRRAWVACDTQLIWVDLVNGQVNSLPVPGTGAPLAGEAMRMKVNFSDGVAYVKSLYSGTGIIAVDLETGEHALVSR